MWPRRSEHSVSLVLRLPRFPPSKLARLDIVSDVHADDLLSQQRTWHEHSEEYSRLAVEMM